MTKTVVDYSKKPRWIISFVRSKKETLGRIMQIRFCQVRTWVEPDGAAIRVRFKYLEPETLRFRFEVPTFGTWIGPFWGLDWTTSWTSWTSAANCCFVSEWISPGRSTIVKCGQSGPKTSTQSRSFEKAFPCVNIVTALPLTVDRCCR